MARGNLQILKSDRICNWKYELYMTHMRALIQVFILLFFTVLGPTSAGAVAAVGTSLISGYLDDGFKADPSKSAAQNEAARQQYEQNTGAMVGAVAAFFASSGRAENVSLGGSIARSAIANNCQLHMNEKELLSRILGRDVQENIFDGDLSELSVEDFETVAAACALVHCADHIADNDPRYAARRALQSRGMLLYASQKILLASGAQHLGYNPWDSKYGRDLLISDFGERGAIVGGFHYNANDGRMDILQSYGYDIYGQARADANPIVAFGNWLAGESGDRSEAALAAWKGLLQSVVTGVEVGQAIIDPNLDIADVGPKTAIWQTLSGLDAMYVANYAFINGQISREEYAQALADGGRTQAVANWTCPDLGDQGMEFTPYEMAVLAAIAYHQPISRAELKEVFGKDINRDLIGRLYAKDLIATGPRSPKRGAPYTYVTTEGFLLAFDLQSLRNLPDQEMLLDAGMAG